MVQTHKLLFLCNRNQCRSTTAEKLFNGVNGYIARSAGTERGARMRVKKDDIEWADIVFCMEQTNLNRVQGKFKREMAGKRLICLQIPDRYGYMAPELVALLEERMGLYLRLKR